MCVLCKNFGEMSPHMRESLDWLIETRKELLRMEFDREAITQGFYCLKYFLFSYCEIRGDKVSCQGEWEFFVSSW